MRRHSDSEHFVSPRAPSDVQQEAVALAELLLKRGGKVCIFMCECGWKERFEGALWVSPS
jgi:hypothetical protein